MNTKPYKPYGGRKKRQWLRVTLAAVLALLVAFGALESYIYANSRSQSAGTPDTMVIFGCQVKSTGPSVLLRDRLDTALDYLQTHPDVKVVVTGGKGDDEHISEAQCMYDYLVAHGVDSGAIYREDRSRDTWQNVNNTLALMEQEGLSRDSVLLVSNDFHLARIRLLWARAGGGTAATLAAPVSHAPSRVRMFFREPLALVKSFFLDH